MLLHRTARPRATAVVFSLALTFSTWASAGVVVLTSNTSTPQTVAATDSLSVQPSVTLTSTTATPAVTWAGSSGAGPVVNNAGVIQNTFNTGASSGRAIDMNFTSASSSFTLNNNAGATITSGNDVFRVNKSIGSGTLVVNNSGVMSSTGLNGNSNGQAIDFNANTTLTGVVTINNFAGAVMSAADADAIRPGNLATINNFGSIVGNTTGDTGNDGIDYQDPGKSGTVNNFGAASSITGARHGITAKEAITVFNAGLIEGRAGSGLNIDTTTNAVAMVVTNTASGRIVGHAVAGADADGIDIDRLAIINNAGLISAQGLSSGTNLNEAIAIGGGSVVNQAGGRILSDQRAITVDDSNLGNAFAAFTLSNDGTITGGNGEALRIISQLGNSVTNRGTINGSVVLGSGADAVFLATGSSLNGLLDGGDGVDVLHLQGSGLGTLGQTASVEELLVDAGDWTLDSGSDYHFGTLSLQAGSSLSLGGANVFSVFTASLLGVQLNGGVVTNLFGGQGFNLYYLADAVGNGYLGGRNYLLSGGGSLIAVPEPASAALVLAGLFLLRRRRA